MRSIAFPRWFRSHLTQRVGRRPLAIASAVFAAAATIMVLVTGGCAKAPGADPRTDPPTVVTAVAAPAGEIARHLSGGIAARGQSKLGFRAHRNVAHAPVDVGEAVKP